MSELDIIPAESLPSVADSQPLDLDAEGQQLRAQAVKSDLGEITPEAEDAAPEAAKQEVSTQDGQQRAADAEPKQEAVKSDSPEASAERDEHGRFKAKAETPYDKAKKEQERQKSVLANFEEEKKRERAAIAQERQELRQMFQQLQQRQQQAQQPQGPRFSSEHLAQAVDEFEATAMKAINEGDTETAQKNFDLARKARAAAQESYFAEQQEQSQAQEMQVSQQWHANATRVIAEHEELKDMNTEPAKRVKALLDNPDLGFLRIVPNGFPLAAKYVANEMAAEASGLKDEKIASLEKQLKELQERTGLNGSGPTPRSERNVEDMSLEEQGRALRRQVAEADRLAYA